MNTNQIETTEQSKVLNDINFNLMNELKESEANLSKANEIIKIKNIYLADFELKFQCLMEECNILRKTNLQLFKDNQLYKQKEIDKELEETNCQKILSINDPWVSDDVLIN
jgi:hypothetical protein